MNLTPEQLRQNAAAMIAFADGKPIQWDYLYSPNGWVDYDSEAPIAPIFDLSVIQYRPKPAPKTRPWSKPEDVPGPVCWMRSNQGAAEQLICAIYVDRIMVMGWTKQDGGEIFFNSLRTAEYSTDRKTWNKCEVQEEP